MNDDYDMYLQVKMILGWTVMEDKGDDWVRLGLIEKEWRGRDGIS
jgi:hypothetical protein